MQLPAILGRVFHAILANILRYAPECPAAPPDARPRGGNPRTSCSRYDATSTETTYPALSIHGHKQSFLCACVRGCPMLGGLSNTVFHTVFVLTASYREINPSVVMILIDVVSNYLFPFTITHRPFANILRYAPECPAAPPDARPRGTHLRTSCRTRHQPRAHMSTTTSTLIHDPMKTKASSRCFGFHRLVGVLSNTVLQTVFVSARVCSGLVLGAADAAGYASLPFAV